MQLLIDFVVDLSHRLADEPDYDLYLRPRLDDLLCYLESLDYSMPRDEASGNVTGAKPQEAVISHRINKRANGRQPVVKRDPHV